MKRLVWMLACTLAFCGAVHARELELASPDGSLHLTVHVGERIGCTLQAGGRSSPIGRRPSLWPTARWARTPGCAA